MHSFTVRVNKVHMLVNNSNVLMSISWFDIVLPAIQDVPNGENWMKGAWNSVLGFVLAISCENIII